MRQWTRTENERPKNGSLVTAISEGGVESDFVYREGLWWLDDGGMYVYYTPLFWRY